MKHDYSVEADALNGLGGIAITSEVMLGLIMLLLIITPKSRLGHRLHLLGAFAVWVGMIGSLAWLTFSPSIHAMKFVSSPVMFPVIGVMAGVVLFSLRRVRKDLYGLLEIAVAVAVLAILGRKFDAQSDVTILVTFVGTIYVVVRGLTNIAEHASASK